MADDIRVRLGFFKHPKTKKLRRRLGGDGVECFMQLWCFCAETPGRARGDLEGLDDEEIAMASGWEGDPDLFVRALVEVRYLDGAPGMYRVHDFSEHQPFVSSGPDRSEAARANALTRWHTEGKHDEEPHTECPLCDSHAARMPSHATGNADSAKRNAPPSLPPSLERDPAQVVSAEAAALGLGPPGRKHRRRVEALGVAVLERLPAALDATRGADTPNWEYLVRCLEAPPGTKRSRAGPGRRRPLTDTDLERATEEWANE